MNFDFGVVLGRMWKIGWNHKVLWLFQMLPGLFSVLILPLTILFNPGFAMFLPEPWSKWANEPWMFVLSIALTFALMIPIMFVATLAQSATTLGALKVEKGAEKLFFRELIRESLPYFWRLVGLYTLFGAAWTLVLILYMVLNIGVSVLTLGLGSLCMMPLFLLLIPILILGYTVLELAQVAIIADNLNIKDAVSKAWQMFRANVFPLVILMLILYLGLAFISGIFIFPVSFPMMFFPLSMGSSGDVNSSFFVVFLVFFPLLMVFMLIVQGILMAFFQSAWAVAYLRLDHGQNKPVFFEAVA